MKLEFSRQTLEKKRSFKFYQNPSSGSQVVSCERTDRQGFRILRTRLKVIFKISAPPPTSSEGWTPCLQLIVLNKNARTVFTNLPKGVKLVLERHETIDMLSYLVNIL